MNVASLALQQTPPLSVPLRFFLTIPLFGFAAALLIIYAGTELLLSRWTTAFLALTHLITLGVIALSISGALLQLLPVLGGVSLPQPVLISSVIHLCLSLGSLSLALGFFLTSPILIRAAWLGLAIGFIVLLAVVSYVLIRSPARSPILTAMRLAIPAAVITVILGLILAALFAWSVNLSAPSLFAPSLFTRLHLAWGLIGWVSLLISGISYQVVPMFQMTPSYPPKLSQWLVPICFILLVIWTTAQFLPALKSLEILSAAGLSVGLGIFALSTLRLQNRRLRKLPDVTLNYWRLGMAGLLASLCLSWLIVGAKAQNRWEIFLGFLFIGGFILPIIQGMLYKIIPFLVWLHLQNRQLAAGKPVKIPNMKQIMSESAMRYQFWLYLIALCCLLAAVAFPPLMSAAGFSLAAAFLGLAYNLYRAIYIYKTALAKIEKSV